MTIEQAVQKLWEEVKYKEWFVAVGIRKGKDTVPDMLTLYVKDYNRENEVYDNYIYGDYHVNVRKIGSITPAD